MSLSPGIASATQALPTCGICGDLRKPRHPLEDAENAGLKFSFSVNDLGRSIQQCPNGGCALLLQAIEKAFPPAWSCGSISARSIGTISLGTRTAKGVQLYVADGDEHPSWPAIGRGGCHVDLSSEESLRFVRDHLAKCMSDHSACQIPADEEAYMPTRILDIGDGDDRSLEPHLRRPIRLLRSADVNNDRIYACLSHMWAPSGGNITTTQATYDQHKVGISFHELSLTYQDTVHVLRRLGVRYVWIDSLCIIQDNAADWRRESKEMARIYGKALFTLTNHTYMTESLRKTANQEHVISSTSFSPPVHIRTSLDHFDTRPYKFPLLHRGWIYQERLLSPRVVHFTDGEIVWECLEEFDCQCGQKDTLRQRTNGPADHPKIQHAQALGLPAGSKAPNEIHLRTRWRAIISEYSGLNLTKISDTLPALQGCADQIREQLGDEYSFGLWTRSSPLDLVWRSHFSNRKYGNPRSPELFQLPTWSWASVRASVSFPTVDSPETEVVPSYPPAHTKQRPVSRVVFKEYENDPCPGQTSTYWLITGQMLPARLARSVPKTGVSTWRRAENVELRVASSYIDVLAQHSALPYHGFEFFADFRLFSKDWNDDVEYEVKIVRMIALRAVDICLVLWRYGKAIPGTGLHRVTPDGHPIYQRIGVVEISHDGLRGEHISVDWDRTTNSTIALE